MDAIRTTLIKETDSRVARIKASSPRGSVSIPYPKRMVEAIAHGFAAQVACKRLYAEVEDLVITTGKLADGSYAHVISSSSSL